MGKLTSDFDLKAVTVAAELVLREATIRAAGRSGRGQRKEKKRKKGHSIYSR
jgi:hypothetical protein